MWRAAMLCLMTALATPASADTPPPDAVPLVPAQAQTAPVAETDVEPIFKQFGLFGTWAVDCAKPAAPDSPQVRVSMPSPGVIAEEHDLGPGHVINHYTVLSAEQVSPTRVSVQVIFDPGNGLDERQTLVFEIKDGTRRTYFNQPEGGPVRVKNGVVLAHGAKTPILKKCM